MPQPTFRYPCKIQSDPHLTPIVALPLPAHDPANSGRAENVFGGGRERPKCLGCQQETKARGLPRLQSTNSTTLRRVATCSPTLTFLDKPDVVYVSLNSLRLPTEPRVTLLSDMVVLDSITSWRRPSASQ